MTEPDTKPLETPKPAEAVPPAPRPQKVTRAPKPRQGFTPPAAPAAPGPVSFGIPPVAPKPRKGKKGPNVLTVKKLAASLAAKFFPKKNARTTAGSDVQVGGFLFRAAGGSGTPNLLATYRTAMMAAGGFVWTSLFQEKTKLHPFGVVAMDTESGRPVVVVDAEFLFRVFGDFGVTKLAQLWALTGPDR